MGYNLNRSNDTTTREGRNQSKVGLGLRVFGLASNVVPLRGLYKFAIGL